MMLKMKKRMGKEMRKNLSIRQYSSANCCKDTAFVAARSWTSYLKLSLHTILMFILCWPDTYLCFLNKMAAYLKGRKKNSTTEIFDAFDCKVHAHTANFPYPDLVVRKYGLFQEPLLIVRKGKCLNLPVHLTSFFIEVIWLCVQHVPYWCCYQYDQNLNFYILYLSKMIYFCFKTYQFYHCM